VYPEFIHALQQRNWTVDTNLDHDHLHDVLPPSKPPVEKASPASSEQGGTEEGDSDRAPESKEPAPFPGNISPQMLWGLKRVLILKNSHIGGHKYAGNVIVSERFEFSLYQFKLDALSLLRLGYRSRVTRGDLDVTDCTLASPLASGLPKSDLVHLVFSASALQHSPFRLRTPVISLKVLISYL